MRAWIILTIMAVIALFCLYKAFAVATIPNIIEELETLRIGDCE